MKQLSVLVLVLSLYGCSPANKVPEESYGIVLRLGEVKEVVTGPAELHSMIFIDKVVIVELWHETILQEIDQSLRYQVTDPVKFYILTTGTLNLDSVLAGHLSALAKDGQEQTIENLVARIKQLKLPIQIVNDA